MQVTAPVPKMSEKAPPGIEIPTDVEDLVRHCLAKEASERLSEAKDLADQLTALLGQLAIQGRVDARYAAPPGSGYITNPGLISGIGPAPDDITIAKPSAPPAPPARATSRQWLIAAGAGTFALLVLVVTIVVVTKKPPEITDENDGGIVETEAGPVTPTKTLDERVEDGIREIKNGNPGSGVKILEEAEARAPERADVHQWLYRAHVSMKNTRSAMREIGLYLRTVPPDTDHSKDMELRVAVRDAALREGDAEPDAKAAVEDAYGLLEKSMGTLGWDDLYDIAYGTSGQQYPKASKRAQADIGTKNAREKMSASLAVTLDLQTGSQDCARLRGLLDRAAEKGDVRTLNVLKTFVPFKSGGPARHDALACMKPEPLNGTIATLSQEEVIRCRSALCRPR